MLKEYPKFARGEVEKIFKKFPKTEQDLINDYLIWRETVGGISNNAKKDLRRYLIHIRYIIDCNFKDFKTLKELSALGKLINDSYLSQEVRKNIRINLKNLFKYLFPAEWQTTFLNLTCFNNPKSKGIGSDEGLSDTDLPTDEEIEKMLKSENSLFWKTFLLYQTITGVRTIEARQTLTKNIVFNEDGTSTIEIFMTKTGDPKYVFCDTQTSNHLKKLIQEQKNTNQYGKYLFHSPTDPNKPIHKNSANKWFKQLSFKATGRYLIPYMLRKKKATQLYNLAKNNKISEHTALKLMGHSRSMMKTYDKTPREEDIKILKEQAFDLEVSPEKRHELELKIEEQNKKIKDLIIKVDNLLNQGYEKSLKKITDKFDKKIK